MQVADRRPVEDEIYLLKNCADATHDMAALSKMQTARPPPRLLEARQQKLGDSGGIATHCVLIAISLLNIIFASDSRFSGERPR